MTERPLNKRVGYGALRVLCRLFGVVLFRIRCQGRHHMPPRGPVLVCSNHQSYFDPVIVGLAFNRRLNYVARKTLFRFAPFRWLIEFLDAIPLDRERGGMEGLKECLRRLRRGEAVLIFPEGTRTRDGEMGPLQPGFVMLARRAGVSILPVGIDGAYQAWPKQARFPCLSRICVCVGAPLGPEEVARLDDAELVAELERRMRSCFDDARRARS